MSTQGLQPYEYQVGGHHTQSDGPPASLKDGKGRFLKKLQDGDRSAREVSFYKTIEQYRQTAAAAAAADDLADDDHSASPAGQQAAAEHTITSSSGSSNISSSSPHYISSMQQLAQWVPRSYGVVQVHGAEYLVLQDMAADYQTPCVLDIKVGQRTWYPWASEEAQQKYRRKDESTTQSTLGFRVCGLLVHNSKTADFRRADRHWGKTLTVDNVHEAFRRFADNGYLKLADLLTGPGMLLDQLQQLAGVFSRQQGFHFFSTSLLVLYEGAAQTAAVARLEIKLIDFAHAFPVVDGGGCSADKQESGPAGVDENFLQGLTSLIAFLKQQLPTAQ